MDSLYRIIGSERSLHEVARTIRGEVQSLRAPVVGAALLTCSDESETECADAFQRDLVNPLLPSLKFSKKAAFRTANLGGQYEWGAMALAEQHFAIPPSADSFKVMVIKLNAHVAVVSEREGDRYGQMQRYQSESPCCGLLNSLLAGESGLPALERAREAFLSEGNDRLATVLDPEQVEPGLRALYAALVSARLQARRVMLDVQDRQPLTPTYYMVLPCVTLNREREDTEILCGVYSADRRSKKPEYHYTGLSDDPSRYRIESVMGRMEIQEAGDEKPRAARDHRTLVAEACKRTDGKQLTDNERIQQLAAKAQKNPEAGPHAKAILNGLLIVLGEVAPIPAAIFLFASGLTGIYQVYRAHRLVGADPDKDDAEHILGDVRAKLDRLTDEQAHRALQALLKHFLPTA